MAEKPIKGDQASFPLDSLADVSAPAPSPNDFLMWNGAAWVPNAGGGGGGTGFRQEFVCPGAGPQQFTLTSGSYVLGTGALRIYVQGKLLSLANGDYSEDNTTQFTVNVITSGERVIAIVGDGTFTGSSGLGLDGVEFSVAKHLHLPSISPVGTVVDSNYDWRDRMILVQAFACESNTGLADPGGGQDNVAHSWINHPISMLSGGMDVIPGVGHVQSTFMGGAQSFTREDIHGWFYSGPGRTQYSSIMTYQIRGDSMITALGWGLFADIATGELRVGWGASYSNDVAVYVMAFASKDLGGYA